jgi:hypothetical protein
MYYEWKKKYKLLFLNMLIKYSLISEKIIKKNINKEEIQILGITQILGERNKLLSPISIKNI